MPLRFRAPGIGMTAEALLARVLPRAAGRERRRLCAEGALRVEKLGGKPGAPGPPWLDPAAAVAPGSAWVLDVDAALAPKHAAPLQGELLHGLAPRLAFGAGELPGGIRFSEVAVRAGVARLRFCATSAGTRLEGDAVAAALAVAGAPLLGDFRHGGSAVVGERALGGVGAEPSWPEEPVFAADLDTGDPKARLETSRETRRALSRGHPWVLRDADTGDTHAWRPGARVRLAGGTEVRLEPAGPVAARVWAIGRGAGTEARVAAALERRAALRAQAGEAGGSDAFRLIHGEADGLPGLHLDRLGTLLRLIQTARCSEPLVPAVMDIVNAHLASELPAEPSWVSVVCLRRPPKGRFDAVRRLSGPEPQLDAEGRIVVREAGLRFAVDPGLASPTRPRPGVGLFLDQRENRARVRARVRPGGRYLNLFAHTGAFSIALLAAGAAEVVSVDLSAAYLRWLDANRATNPGGGQGRHRAVRSDGRRYLERLAPGECFDGIVLDPPTAAAAGRRFWNVRRDLEPLATTALARLAPGGWLLLSRNDRRVRPDWAPGLARSTRTRVQDAGPGPDFPALEGFPEGDPFRGWLFSRP